MDSNTGTGETQKRGQTSTLHTSLCRHQPFVFAPKPIPGVVCGIIGKVVKGILKKSAAGPVKKDFKWDEKNLDQNEVS